MHQHTFHLATGHWIPIKQEPVPKEDQNKDSKPPSVQSQYRLRVTLDYGHNHYDTHQYYDPGPFESHPSNSARRLSARLENRFDRGNSGSPSTFSHVTNLDRSYSDEYSNFDQGVNHHSSSPSVSPTGLPYRGRADDIKETPYGFAPAAPSSFNGRRLPNKEQYRNGQHEYSDSRNQVSRRGVPSRDRDRLKDRKMDLNLLGPSAPHKHSIHPDGAQYERYNLSFERGRIQQSTQEALQNEVLQSRGTSSIRRNAHNQGPPSFNIRQSLNEDFCKDDGLGLNQNQDVYTDFDYTPQTWQAASKNNRQPHFNTTRDNLTNRANLNNQVIPTQRVSKNMASTSQFGSSLPSHNMEFATPSISWEPRENYSSSAYYDRHSDELERFGIMEDEGQFTYSDNHPKDPDTKNQYGGQDDDEEYGYEAGDIYEASQCGDEHVEDEGYGGEEREENRIWHAGSVRNGWCKVVADVEDEQRQSEMHERSMQLDGGGHNADIDMADRRDGFRERRCATSDWSACKR